MGKNYIRVFNEIGNIGSNIYAIRIQITNIIKINIFALIILKKY